MSSLILTHHAVERFRKRWVPELGYDDARQALIVLASEAKPMTARSLKGDEMWIADGVRFVVRRDGDGLPPTCVTVLEREAGLLADADFEDPFGDPLPPKPPLLAAIEARDDAMLRLRKLEQTIHAAREELVEAQRAVQDANDALHKVQREAGGR